jgi:NADH dehydrogenase (ubiquinone) 1 alpha/beta subcomplex 1
MTYVEVKFYIIINKKVMVEVEREFEIEFPDEDVERFRNVNDAVEFIARSFFAV